MCLTKQYDSASAECRRTPHAEREDVAGRLYAQESRRSQPGLEDPLGISAGARQVRSVAEGLSLLTQLVTTAKRNVPLAAVTVIVPTHQSGLDATRHLARTVNGGRGVVNVHARTIEDIAQLLHQSSGDGAGRSLLSGLVREGAIHAVLTDDPGSFSDVADQPATARALAAASRTLDVVGPPTGPAAQLSALAREVLRVHQSTRARVTAGWFTKHDQFTVGCDAVRSDASGFRATFGTVIAFLLPTHDDLEIDERTLLDYLRAATPLTEIALAQELDAVSTDIVSATDPDDETRAVARRVVDLLRKGTPAHRIGVFWGAEDPYRPLLHRHFAEAGITANGPAARQLQDTALVRSVLSFLALDPAGVDLRVVLDVLAEGCLNWDAELLPSSAQCERLYGTTAIEDPDDGDEVREATTRVVSFDDEGPETEGADADQSPAQNATRVARQREIFSRQQLLERYLAAAAASVAAVSTAASWNEAANAVDSLVAEHFVPRVTFDDDHEDSRARQGLRSSIDALRRLDGVAPLPAADDAGVLSVILAALDTELADHRLNHNKAGVGVSLGPLSDGIARDLEVVFVVGLAEGVTPPRSRDDPLLPDEVRKLWSGALPSLAERTARQKRLYRAALESASSLRVLTYPRGDLRGGGDREPSRWLGDDQGSAPTEHLGSYHDGIEGFAACDVIPATAQEWRMRRLRTELAERPDAPADPVLDSAWAMRRDRSQGLFTRFNGNLSALADRITVLDGPIPATSLEDWVVSPLSYFLQRVLGLRPFEDVQLRVEIDPLNRGILLHEILESYAQGQLAGEEEADSLKRLLDLAEQAFLARRAQSDTAGWLDHLWRRDTRTMRTDLRLWWERTVAERVVPHSAEASFGTTDAEHPSVPFILEDGSTIAFSGKVDRIDWVDNSHIRVVDYKTGTAAAFTALSAERPTAEGHKFQLPIYGLFAKREAEHYGLAGMLHAEYDFVTRKGGQQMIGYEVTDDVVATLRKDISLVVRAVLSGIFPAVPVPSNFVSFTSLIGSSGMEHLWARLYNAPELVPFIDVLPQPGGEGL